MKCIYPNNINNRQGLKSLAHSESPFKRTKHCEVKILVHFNELMLSAGKLIYRRVCTLIKNGARCQLSRHKINLLAKYAAN
ncbi:hypothetical protein NIES4075_03560 [Tolypothrix sp. NIES-4075]|nr:hypothetical protein NIES4075_03560 [Tolypothrix sp. NIES-4075]